MQVGDRVGVPWLGLDRRHLRVLHERPREPVPERPLHRAATSTGATPSTRSPTSASASRSPPSYSDEQASPLLCAGLIGYRALRMTGDARRVGFYGFGDSAHILVQICRWQGREVYAFTRPGDTDAQDFALELGAVWAGSSEEAPPETLEAAIIFAPVGALVPAALRALAPGGTVVCGGIHMSDIPVLPLRDPLARAGGALGRQPDPRRRRGAARAGPPGARARRTSRPTRSRRRTTRSPTCAPARSPARP